MNGQEKDNEIDGNSGNTMGAEFWEYDARIGRRYNIDPIEYACQSPYATFDNSPIGLADPEGLEARAGGDGPKNPSTKRRAKWTGGKQNFKKGGPGNPKSKESESPGKKPSVYTKENWQKVGKAFEKLADKAAEAADKFDPSNSHLSSTSTYHTNQPGTGGSPGTAMDWIKHWDKESTAKEWQDKTAMGVGKGSYTNLWGFDFVKSDGDYARTFDGAAIKGNLLPNWTMNMDIVPGASGVPESIRNPKKWLEEIKSLKGFADILLKGAEYDEQKAKFQKVRSEQVKMQVVKVTYTINRGSTPISVSGNGLVGETFNPGDTIWKETVTITKDGNGKNTIKIKLWKPRN